MIMQRAELFVLPPRSLVLDGCPMYAGARGTRPGKRAVFLALNAVLVRDSSDEKSRRDD
jgi:hypothetical protein